MEVDVRLMCGAREAQRTPHARVSQAKKPRKRLNTKEGLIHFKRRVERDDDEDAPAAQRPRLVQPQQHHGLDDQFGD